MKKILILLLTISGFVSNAQVTTDTNGNVGIGTTTPTSKLEVNGTIIAGNNASTDGQNILSGKYGNGTIANWGSLWSSASAFMGFGVKAKTGSPGGFVSSTPIGIIRSALTTDSEGFHILSNGTNQAIAEGTAASMNETFTVKANGNVGIGKSNPITKLDVVGDSNLIDASSRITGYNDRNNYYLGNYPVVNSAGLDIHWYGGIKFGTQNGDAMQILQNGDIGIGTNSPLYKLDVKGASYSYEHTIQSYSPTLILKRDTNTGGFTEGIQTRLLDGTDNWYFGTLGTADWIVSKGNYQGIKFVINENGNVGIGTAAPTAKLDVNGTVNTTGTITATGTILTKTGVSMDLDNVDLTISKDSDVLDWTTFRTNKGNGIALIGQPDNPALIVSRTNSFVGIGTTTPQTKLDVVGKSSFSDNMKVNAKIEAKEIKVTTTPTADFVFANDYNLPKLEEVEKHIKDKKHLPEIASAKEMEKEGVNVGEFQIKLLQKIEELTLYVIDQNKEIKDLKRELNELKAKK